MKCKCGFEFSGPGEPINHACFASEKGESGVICAKCCREYVDGKEVS